MPVRVNGHPEVHRLLPVALSFPHGHEDVRIAEAGPSVRREIERFIIGMDERALLVIRSIDGRTEIFRFAPLAVFLKLAHPDVESALSAFAVAAKIERASIARQAGLCFLCYAVDWRAQVLRLRPLIAHFI